MKVLDLFSGAGGLSLGLHNAGWEVVAAIEYDKYATATYQANFPDTQVIQADIKSVDFSKWRGKVELVAGGPPCQPFSVAGNQRAAYDERDCVPDFIRAVEAILPTAFVMENVPGLTTLRHQPYLQNILAQFEQLGYVVTKTILNAADFGVPQFRRRLFIVGLKVGGFNFPKPTHGSARLLPYVTAGEALRNTPPDRQNTAIVSYAKKPVLRPSPYAGMLVNGGGRPINLDEPSQTIPATAGGNRTHIVDEAGVFLEYHHYLLSGGTPREGLVQGVRRLTVRESARIQSFPDTFAFTGPSSALYRQVGNAVPPRLAQVVGHCLFESLFEKNETLERPTQALEQMV